MATWLDVLNEAYAEWGVTQGITAEEYTFAKAKANQILDNWNAERCAVYADTLITGTLTAGLQPATIGPTGATYTQTSRPVSIEAANVILTAVTPNVRQAIRLRDRDWWMANTVQRSTSDYPTDLWYEPLWPNGKLWFWPKPTTAYGVEFLVRQFLSAITSLSATFSMPPGYQNAITLTLAEDLAPSFGATATLSPITVKKAQQARARIFANNDQIPRISTIDAGMPGARHRATFNYLTGQSF